MPIRDQLISRLIDPSNGRALSDPRVRGSESIEFARRMRKARVYDYPDQLSTLDMTMGWRGFTRRAPGGLPQPSRGISVEWVTCFSFSGDHVVFSCSRTPFVDTLIASRCIPLKRSRGIPQRSHGIPMEPITWQPMANDAKRRPWTTTLDLDDGVSMFIDFLIITNQSESLVYDIEPPLILLDYRPIWCTKYIIHGHML